VSIHIQEVQDATPIRAPLRREIEDVSRNPFGTAREIIVSREEMSRAVESGLRIRHRDRVAPRDLPCELEEVGRVQELKDPHRVDIEVPPERMRIVLRHLLACALAACGSDAASSPTTPLEPVVAVASVALSQNAITIGPPGTAQLIATAKDAAGTTLVVRTPAWSWSSRSW
jgi:hypothetical protein